MVKTSHKTGRIITAIIACCLTSLIGHAAPKPVKQVYIPMDYSTCGYHASECKIPDVANAVFVAAGGDIQQAIDYVATLKPDADGHRGAVLLGEGTFLLDEPLRISTPGIVIRGMGRDRTVLVKRGVDRGAAIYIEGVDRQQTGDSRNISDEKVVAGSLSFHVDDIRGLSVGDRIQITRPCTAEWIQALKMNDFGGGLDYTGWKPTDMEITWDRTITAINGNEITTDAPITTTLSRVYGGATFIKGYNKGEIRECGIENLTIKSEKNEWNTKDEDHCWGGIQMRYVRDCWVRRVIFSHLAGSAVNIQRECSRITIEDCIAQEPVSEIGGWRRNVFLTRGQQTLIQRCVSRQGIHDFVAGDCAAGPNAFVQCEGEQSLGFSGSIGSWAGGLLFDIVNIDGNDIRLANLEQFQMGTGWNSANSMVWQCTASTIWCYSPDEENRSSGHGCWGTLTGNAEWTSSNDHVQPRSLFYAQLQERLQKRPDLTATPPSPNILPRDMEATSSPTVEQAMKMAQVSLQEPRLTMEMWIDSIPYTAALDSRGLKTLSARRQEIPVKSTNHWDIQNGHLAVNGQLIVGNRYDIPWWNGRVKDNFVTKSAKPAITRFVPGREGLGWTDRIDSVVTFMKQRRYCMLDHHYGLWYDLRRIDHERVRRADGEVSAPFYEQPFARSGEGIANDGLSKYDLSKPDEWYWHRLSEYAEKGGREGLLLFHQHYFQHNILEAGAHWVDCPWRTVNNINGTDFPEPVPFTGDKRIFMAEQFYDISNPVLRPLHRQYIRMCLEQLKDRQNTVHLISSEYTGPLHFTRFWLETIAEWEAETGHHPLIALSCTKDAQDAILQDPILNKVVDIIDIRYWHYNTQELWAPEAGKNMAPRQWMRKWKVGKTGFDEVYRAVREYRERYPDKAVTFFSQQYPEYGWAILMAGGSLPNVHITHDKLLSDLCKMQPMDGEGCVAIGDKATGYLVYAQSAAFSVRIESGKYNLYEINAKSGEVKLSKKAVKMKDAFSITDTSAGKIFWLEKS